MSKPDIVPWDRLPQSSASTVLGIIRRLADGFTGRIELDCRDGAVTQVRDSRIRAPKEFERDAA